MHVNIRLFARLKEVVGASELQRAVPEGAAAADAWNALVVEFPALGAYTRSVSCAVTVTWKVPLDAVVPLSMPLLERVRPRGMPLTEKLRASPSASLALTRVAK